MKLEIQTNLSRSCKGCNTEFTIIIPETNGSGSKNSLRRIFCTDKCKNQYNRKKQEGKITRECKVCNKNFLSYPSQNNSFCSKKCKIASQIKLTTNNCLLCNITFEAKPSRINEFFCSRKCFNDFNRETKVCVTCKKTFQIKKSDSHIVRCSRKCQFIDQSNGKIKIHLNGRTGYRIDLGFKYYFKSSLEADFARFLNYFGIEFQYEQTTFQTTIGAYTPDFFIPQLNLFIELKGVENNGKPFENLMTRNLEKQEGLKEKNYNIITITQKEFINGIKKAELWNTIPNLEQKNYKKTRNLVVQYEDQKNSRE